MDADFREKRRTRDSSHRRWSMNSQRLEEIVAELMRPIGDIRHSFDTDLSALLEEYLTEAGLHALAAEEGSDAEDEVGAPPATAVNFVELALLLQQSASIYGRKVDCLYQHVLSVSDALHNSTMEMWNPAQAGAARAPTPGAPHAPGAAEGSPRRRRASAASAGWERVVLQESAAARRDAQAPRPPPTLPRMYVELEPRAPDAGDAPLRDYGGEPAGLRADLHVAWRLQDGLLVDELEGSPAALRPIPLMELQAAIAAHAPSPPPRAFTPPPGGTSTPLPPASPPPAAPPPAAPPPPAEPPARRERKRRSGADIEELSPGRVKILISKELRRELSACCEFSVPHAWLRAELRARTSRVLALRRRLRAREPEFRGFEFSSADVAGFVGWSSSEATLAADSLASLSACTGLSLAHATHESDDDGFFEQSSLGDSDGSRVDESQWPRGGGAEGEAWRARVLGRAAAAEARGAVDVRALGAALLRALPPAPAERRFGDVLRDAARDHSDVSRLFLTALFLANAGSVCIVPGAPLAVDAFSLRVVSEDARLLRAAAADDALPR